MNLRFLLIGFFISYLLLSIPNLSICQELDNVPKAFESLGHEPEIIIFESKVQVPTAGGHLQGVQLVEVDGEEKLFVSGSSHHQSYIVQLDMASKKAEKVIPLMDEPFRHAGGIQASKGYLIVGIEDNHSRTSAKVCLYDFQKDDLIKAKPNFMVTRNGEEKRPTAGATGLLAMDKDFLMVVGNWDARNWDFYELEFGEKDPSLIYSFEAPEDWASYQSINLLKDKEVIYAIGFYQKGNVDYADLILVSKMENFDPIMRKLSTKSFHCKDGVDFSGAAGLQVDKAGNLVFWGTQKNAGKQIIVNRFSGK
ncbi:hypothetical protein IFO69_04460 [Echinicola sp. CAU 1574]|uniref:Uncharacterized protein n=1 Tax=Echinicola arenosa TaxID=2774144 RepID=A0ABR9AGK7_9BACT|nr:hypothetical protein [Echinicola arenosa]MBD8487995.1 hypothetical protein [Echinicola arenosa]